MAHEDIISRALKDRRVANWLILAGSLDRFVADVLSHTVESILTNAHTEIRSDASARKKILDIVHYKSPENISYINEHWELIKENVSELAKVFVKDKKRELPKFELMDVTYLVQIMRGCNLFHRYSSAKNNILDLLDNVRKSRNHIMHNKSKLVEKKEFDEAFQHAKNLLLCSKEFESLWHKKSAFKRSNIESCLDKLKHTSMSSLNKEEQNSLVLKAVVNNVAVLEDDCHSMLYDCDKIKAFLLSMLDILDNILSNSPLTAGDQTEEDLQEEAYWLQELREKLKMVYKNAKQIDSSQLTQNNLNENDHSMSLLADIKNWADELSRLQQQIKDCQGAILLQVNELQNAMPKDQNNHIQKTVSEKDFLEFKSEFNDFKAETCEKFEEQAKKLEKLLKKTDLNEKQIAMLAQMKKVSKQKEDVKKEQLALQQKETSLCEQEHDLMDQLLQSLGQGKITNSTKTDDTVTGGKPNEVDDDTIQQQSYNCYGADGGYESQNHDMITSPEDAEDSLNENERTIMKAINHK